MGKKNGKSEKTLSVSSVLWAIDSWLQDNDPELLSDLLPPASLQELQHLTDCLGKKLPHSFCELYLCHNGQATDAKRLLSGWYFMPLEGGGLRGALEQYSTYKDSHIGRSDGFVKPMKCNTLWIPFATDFDYNFLAIDLDPPEEGKKEQVICFGRSQKAYKLADSLAEYLLDVAVQLGVQRSLLEESTRRSRPRDTIQPPRPGKKVNLFAQSREQSLWSQGAKPALPDNVVEFRPGVHKTSRVGQAEKENTEASNINKQPDTEREP